MSDIRCNRCGYDKPEIAYPSRKGKRTGRICKACYAARRHHHARKTGSTRAQFEESRRRWGCPTCGRVWPEVFPATTSTNRPVPAGTPCRGCHSRDAARRRKEAKG